MALRLRKIIAVDCKEFPRPFDLVRNALARRLPGRPQLQASALKSITTTAAGAETFSGVASSALKSVTTAGVGGESFTGSSQSTLSPIRTSSVGTMGVGAGGTSPTPGPAGHYALAPRGLAEAYWHDVAKVT